MNEQPKLYTITKYLKANNVADALRLERTTPIHEVTIEDDWKLEHLPISLGLPATIENDLE